MLEPVVRSAPAFASQIVNAAFSGRRGRVENGVGEDIEEVANRLRRTMGAWIEGLGPLASFSAPVRGDGSLGTLAISGWDGRGQYAWYAGPAELPEVIPLSQDVETKLALEGWRSPWRGGFGEERQASWAWRSTFKDLRRELQEALKVGKLPAQTSMLAREAAWRAAKDLLFKLRGRTRLENRAVDLDEIESCLNEVGAWNGDWISMVPPGLGSRTKRRFYEVHHLVEEVRRLRASGKTEMTSPVPVFDLSVDEAKGRLGEEEGLYSWDLYSDEQLFERAMLVVEEALRGYAKTVEILFPKLAPHILGNGSPRRCTSSARSSRSRL